MSVWLGYWPSSLRGYLSLVMSWAWNFLVRRKRHWEDLPRSLPRAGSTKGDDDETATPQPLDQAAALVVTPVTLRGQQVKTIRFDGRLYIDLEELGHVVDVAKRGRE